MPHHPSTPQSVTEGRPEQSVTEGRPDPLPEGATPAVAESTSDEAVAPTAQLLRRLSRHRLRLLRRRRFMWRLRGDRFTVTGRG